VSLSGLEALTPPSPSMDRWGLGPSKARGAVLLTTSRQVRTPYLRIDSHTWWYETGRLSWSGGRRPRTRLNVVCVMRALLLKRKAGENSGTTQRQYVRL